MCRSFLHLLVLLPGLMGCRSMPLPAAAQPHERQVRTLLERIGYADQARHAVEAQIYLLRDARPDIPGEFWVEFMASVRTNALLDSLTTVFAGRLAESDVAQLTDMTATPDGLQALRAWTEALPTAAAIRTAWEAEVGRRLENEMIKNGYKPP